MSVVSMSPCACHDHSVQALTTCVFVVDVIVVV
jgi:hypothetical protein